MNDRSSTKIRKPKSPILHSTTDNSNTDNNYINNSHNNSQFKMARKSSFLKPTIIFTTFLFFLAFFAFLRTTTTTFSSSSSSSSSLLSQLTTATAASETDVLELTSGNDGGRVKVRVFMYDLPVKFTTGIIERHALARGSTDLSKVSYPGHQHMGEWYLYQDMLRSEEDRGRVGSVVTRVDDPEEADMFYVPVFSSLSLIVNTAQSGQEYSDEEMQESLMEWLEQQEYWRRNNGRDHVIMAGDPNALYRILDRVKNAILLVSDFGRVRPDQGSLVKDVIVPYAHRINTYQGEIGVEKRDTLLFFMGNRYRKDVSFT